MYSESDLELIADFIVESTEGLGLVESQMLALEEEGDAFDVDLVNAVFRTMHSIKGAASFLGLLRIEQLAHRLEDVLNRLRNREIDLHDQLVSTILRSTDFITELIENATSSNDADVSAFLAELDSFCQEQPPESPCMNDAQPSEPEETPAAETPREELDDALREFVVECFENLDDMERHLIELEENPGSTPLLRSVFRTMHTVKGGAGFLGLGELEALAHATESILSEIRDGKRQLTNDASRVLFASIDKCREGIRVLEKSGNDSQFDAQVVIKALTALGEPGTSPVTTTEKSSTNSETSAPSTGPVLTSVSPVDANAQKALSSESTPPAENEKSVLGESTIRVDVSLLDQLMTRVGELVLARNQLLQYTNAVDDASFTSTAQRLNHITTELQEGVMKTRMQPIGNVWAKFPRVVRDLSSQLGKEVRIEMEGKETELDKTIIEAIKDPLTHLVRNSVDHGIESPEERRQVGKPSEGQLLLRAYHEGGQVNIEIIDDGAGLNLNRIRDKAVERGLISQEQAARISDHEANQLIMLPGFSTAEKVSSISGRGVGMDVVKSNIERIGGTIDIHSQPGEGTTIKVKIPLTLAIIPALIVTVGKESYAIPQASLLELVRLEGEAVQNSIEYIHGAPVYRLRGKLLPLVSLSKCLGDGGVGSGNWGATSTTTNEVVANIIVLRASEQAFGLVVDKINDTEEIVVKPLSRQLKNISEFAGATIMGDGQVALILDVMGLALTAGVAGESRSQAVSFSASDEQAEKDIQSFLIVSLGDARRFAMPTSMVSRLEKIPSASIEITDGREVIQYRGSILPLLRLDQIFGSHSLSSEDPEELQVVVYADDKQSCGLVVHRIIDAAETELRYQTEKEQGNDILGTAIIQDRVTDVLNLPQLALRVANTNQILMSC